MAVLAVQRVVDTGLAPVYTAVSAADDVECDDVVVHVKNGNAAVCNVTIVTPGSIDGDLAVPDRVVAVPAGTDKFIGPFPSKIFKSPSTGKARLTYSVLPTVTIAALKL